MFHWRKAIVATFAAFSLGSASAALIVDTGAPPAGNFQLSLDNQGVSFQHLGVTFSVASDSSITSVEGWIGVFDPGNLLIELHDGASPNDAVLFSSQVAAVAGASSWLGATGLDWDVTAGDYTVTITAQPGFSGGMDPNPPNPAGAEWFSNSLSGGWSPATFNLGWRVGADLAVPEPAAYSLVLLALAAAAAARRRGQRKPA